MAWTSFAILATFLSKTGCFSGGSTTAIRGHPRKRFWKERLLRFSWVTASLGSPNMTGDGEGKKIGKALHIALRVWKTERCRVSPFNILRIITALLLGCPRLPEARWYWQDAMTLQGYIYKYQFLTKRAAEFVSIDWSASVWSLTINNKSTGWIHDGWLVRSLSDIFRLCYITTLFRLCSSCRKAPAW